MNNSNILRESADFLNHIYKMAMTTTKWTIILGVGVSDVGKCIYGYNSQSFIDAYNKINFIIKNVENLSKENEKLETECMVFLRKLITVKEGIVNVLDNDFGIIISNDDQKQSEI